MQRIINFHNKSFFFNGNTFKSKLLGKHFKAEYEVLKVFENNTFLFSSESNRPYNRGVELRSIYTGDIVVSNNLLEFSRYRYFYNKKFDRFIFSGPPSYGCNRGALFADSLSLVSEKVKTHCYSSFTFYPWLFSKIDLPIIYNFETGKMITFKNAFYEPQHAFEIDDERIFVNGELNQKNNTYVYFLFDKSNGSINTFEGPYIGKGKFLKNIEDASFFIAKGQLWFLEPSK